MDNQQSSSSSLPTIYYFVFAAEAFGIALIIAYLIVTHASAIPLAAAMGSVKNIIIGVLVTVLATGCLTFGSTYAVKKVFGGSSTSQMMGGSGDSSSSSSVEATGATTVTDDQTLTDTYETSDEDTSVILVTDGGNATITGATITKSGGDSSNTENSEFYGVNAGILVQEGSTATITGATISTDATGSNAVFATGEDAKITISDSTITTTGASSARGLDATYGGTIIGDNLTVTTQGNSCATLATDRGEGTVTVTDSTLETNGSGSPVIYSTGTISIDNTTGTANGSQAVVVEGKNSATVTNSTLTCTATPNRDDVDQCGVMLYQSMSGDASEGTASFTAEGSTIEISSSSDYYKTAPMFFVTNTDAEINLTNTKLVYGSGVLLSVEGTDEWGTSGSNGGDVTLTAKNQTLEGDIEVDKISTLTMTLTDSDYTGTINGDNTASSISLTLDAESTITLTGDTYVTSLDDEDEDYSNINFNGYKLYVNGTAIN